MSKKTNTFSRALRHLKSDQRDALTEQPTNNTQGLMTKEPSEYIDPVPDGTTWYKDVPLDLDFDKDEDADDGQNTSGIFESDGTILTIEPPGDTSYVLGPMSAMWYAWGNFTRIGYIRQEDRRMVNLASLTGELGAWDGTADAFSSYGQLTLAQADWFRTTPKKDGAGNDTPNYRAFYAGPPSNTPDEFGRYLCVITGTAKEVETAQTADTPGYTTKPVEGPEDPTTMFSALMNRLNKAGKNIRDVMGNIEGTTWGKLAGSILRSIMDPITYAGDFIFKGLPSGIPYDPAFKGAGPKWAGGKKITDMLGGLFGKDVQYFTPDLDTAIKYAGEGGSVVAMPRPKTGVQGMKNWLGSTVSRGFDPTKGVEQIVKTSDSVAAKNLTKVINLSDEGSAATLKALAAKGATNNKILAKLGKAVPFLNAGLVVADVTNRISKGDYAGALLGGLQIIPGPVGWLALGSQLAYDVSGATHPWNKPVTEAVDKESSEMSDNMGAALIEMGLPKDKNEFIKEMGFYLMLQEQIEPNLLSMILKALQGEELSSEQQQWMDKNFLPMIKAVANRNKKGKKNVKESLGEERIWLREIRKPVKVPELQKKFKGIKPRVKKKGEDYRVIGGGLMKNEAVPAEFNPTRENRMWRKYEYNQNVRASQEKKNQVLELIGEGDHQWNYMLGNERWRTASQMKKFYGDHDYLYDYYYGGKKHRVIRKEGIEKDFLLFIEDENGVKDTIRQSELNDLLAEERDKEDFKEYYMHETQQKEREKNFDRATRLKTIIGKIKRGDIKPEHPEEEPPKMINGWHPKLGKHYKYDKLDPISAQSMPPTGDPEIDANVEKAKRRPK